MLFLVTNQNSCVRNTYKCIGDLYCMAMNPYVTYSPTNDTVFVISLPQTIKFGFGVSKEVGYEAKRLGLKRVLLVVGKKLVESKLFEDVRQSLENEGVAVEINTRVRVEPEDEELIEAYREIKDKDLDGFVALGGGSTIDT